MKWMKRTALALVAGAALSLSAVTPSSAAPIGQSTAAGLDTAAKQFDGNLVEVRRRHRHGRRHWRRHRHGGGNGWWVPFVVAPLLFDDYGYRRGYRYRRDCRYDYC